MLVEIILILLAIHPISTSIAQCEGEKATLSCLENHSDEIETKSVMWKKRTGVRVIWRISETPVLGNSFTNRSISLNNDLTLLIEECVQADAGVYILFIDRIPRCEVRLFIKDNCTKLLQKTGPEKQTSDQKNEQNFLNIYKRWVVFFVLCLFLLLCLTVCQIPWIKKSTCEKSESEQLDQKLQII